MGYSTYVTISMSTPDYKDVGEQMLMEIKDYFKDKMDLEFEDWGQKISLGDCRWYGMDEEMYTISTRFHKVLFTIYGDGDDSDDIWYEYWLDGARQTIGVRFDDFCRRRLIPYDKDGNREYQLPAAYLDRTQPVRSVADELFAMSAGEVSSLGAAVLRCVSNRLQADTFHIGDSVRKAYDANNAAAMLEALTGCTMEELMQYE